MRGGSCMVCIYRLRREERGVASEGVKAFSSVGVAMGSSCFRAWSIMNQADKSEVEASTTPSSASIFTMHGRGGQSKQFLAHKPLQILPSERKDSMHACMHGLSALSGARSKVPKRPSHGPSLITRSQEEASSSSPTTLAWCFKCAACVSRFSTTFTTQEVHARPPLGAWSSSSRPSSAAAADKANVGRRHRHRVCPYALNNVRPCRAQCCVMPTPTITTAV